MNSDRNFYNEASLFPLVRKAPMIQIARLTFGNI